MAARSYWLMKTEPGVFSWDDLMRCPGHTDKWDGVRNFQARNFLRDSMRKGDGVLFYHSGEERAIVGLAEVARAGYPDPSAFDEQSRYFDPKSDPGQPTWYVVDVRAVRPLPAPLTLPELRTIPELADMMLLRRGSRLSVQPVTAAEWQTIVKRARAGRQTGGQAQE